MKGMIFDAESVKAILAGNKTQSRRVIKGASPDDDQPSLGHSPRYREGETVYIKESYAIGRVVDDNAPCHYKANGALMNLDYRTPLFIPEPLSRIKLRIVRVSCERVHDISMEDCIKEGAWSVCYTTTDRNWFYAWQRHWIEVNGLASWDSNPWVWVYEFEEVK